MSNDQTPRELGPTDPTAVERARAVVERLRWVYVCDWAPEALDEMEAAVLALRRYAREGEDGEAARHDAVLRLSHAMKGQAHTFGLDLLADFAASIHAIARAARRIGEREADVVLAHILAMRTALSAAANDADGLVHTGLERDLRQNLRRIVRSTLN
ncbi:MAG: Hpt domain-containing protein [Alphaproteobacteria bacterium]|nr:Hpt domain-containing protein [Alphaproteobacteria bacterium]MCB9931148.1 Hpt domain-containing protein [Alphaproteobacteria bacterium]